MINKRTIMTVILLSLILISLRSLQVPVFLKWNSTNGYIIPNNNGNYTDSSIESYKITAGIDTVLYNNVQTSFAFTNEDRLSSKVLIDHVCLDYSYKSLSLNLSMQDFGFGKNYYLFNRRYDDLRFDKNALFYYRWNGLLTSFTSEKMTLRAGIAANEHNRLLSEADLNYTGKNFNVSLFMLTAQHDSNKENLVYNYGADISSSLNKLLKFKSSNCYKFIPPINYWKMEKQFHTINEINLRMSDNINLIISSEHNVDFKSNKTDYLYEGCLNPHYKRLDSSVGFRTKSIPDDQTATYFFDTNFTLTPALKVGTYFDYTDLKKGSGYTKFGIQTSYFLQ